MLHRILDNGLVTKLTAHIPPEQFTRYLLVGLWNTAFGYGTYTLLTALLTPRVPYAYLAASVIASLLSITSAFLAYKWIVFKTSGNYLREWLRCLTVYGTIVFINILLLPAFVFLLRRSARFQVTAPYVAGALVLLVTTGFGFFFHKNFSFAASNPRKSSNGRLPGNGVGGQI